MKEESTVELRGIGLLETMPAAGHVIGDDAQLGALEAGGVDAVLEPGSSETREEAPRVVSTEQDIRARVGPAIGQYEIIRELGRGGMGAVFLARDTRLGRRVAIKLLRMDSAAQGARLIAEARVTARCNHGNIVVIHEAGERDGLHYMVLEYLEGQTLRQLLDDVRTSSDDVPALSPERAVELIVPVVRALECAHDAGIVHRDLKPENVMITRSGVIKVLDFGVAQVRARDDQAPAAEQPERVAAGPAGAGPTGAKPLVGTPGGFAGTIPYMSPEQVCCEELDQRTDIWAVGIMLYEVLTGEHPLARSSRNRLETIAALDVPMPRLSEIRPQLGALGQIVDRCLLKDRDARTGTARELLDELEPLMPGRHDINASDRELNPFAGLAAYQESDATRFFGRSRDIAGVVTRVRNQPLVMVIGPSGVGKSSLIRAGVIPALKQSGEGWEAVVMRPGREPLAALTQLMARFDRHSTSHPSGQIRVEGVLDPPAGEPDPADDFLRGDSVWRQQQLRSEPGLVGTGMRAWAQTKMRRVLVFVDQFEEIFTLTADPAERRAFLACLLGIADDASSRLRVIVSMRADLVEHMAQERELVAAATGGMIFLSPIERPGLREALEKPVRAAGYRFEHDDIIEHMLDTLERTRGSLPLLQFTASRLWELRDRKQRLLTRASHESLGGVSGALAKHADAVLSGMSARSLELTRAIFERLVTPERTRAIASMDELCQLSNDKDRVIQVLEELAGARLVLVDTGDEERGTVEIVHESLIDGWPTLRAWLDENQEDAAFLAKLRAAAREWEKSERAEGMLWRGDVADKARAWRRRYQGQLGEREAGYLDAVLRLADRQVLWRRIITYGAVAAALLLVAAFAIAATKSHQVDTIRRQERQLQRSLQAETTARQAADEARARAEIESKRAEVEKREAEIARDEANQLRLLAESARQEALEQSARAEAARIEADAQRKEAELLKAQAERDREQIAAQKREIEKLMNRHGVRHIELDQKDSGPDKP